jgi:hypothetical protein
MRLMRANSRRRIHENCLYRAKGLAPNTFINARATLQVSGAIKRRSKEKTREKGATTNSEKTSREEARNRLLILKFT